MKRFFFLIAGSLILASCGRTVTVRTSSGTIVEIPNDTARIGQDVSLMTTKNIYHILPNREATGARMIGLNELYVMQGTVIKAN